jgi:hypothetical protein
VDTYYAGGARVALYDLAFINQTTGNQIFFQVIGSDGATSWR